MAANPMNLDLPVPENTTGPAWAQQLNTQLETVVAPHDHTSGKGVQLTQDALAINGDLPLNGNDLTGVRTTRFNSLAANPIEVDDVNALCSVGGELTYIDGQGNVVPLTSNGAIDVGSVQGISGLAAPASAGFAGGTFTFKDTATTYADMAHGPVVLYSGDEASPTQAVTLKSPNALATGYNITFPTALPAATSFVTISNTGQLTNTIPVSLGINTANIANNAITPAKMATLSPSSTTVDSVDLALLATYTQLGSDLVVTSTGRPILISFAADPDNSDTVTPPGIYYRGNNQCGWTIRIRFNVNAGAYSTGALFNQVNQSAFYSSPPLTDLLCAPLNYTAIIYPASGLINIKVEAVRSGQTGGLQTAVIRYGKINAFAL